MPGLAYKYNLDTDVMSDSNQTDCSKSVLSLPSINISSTSPLSNVHVTSSPVLHDSLPKDLDDLSLQDSPVLTLPDSPLVPHRSLPTSLISLSDEPVDDLEKSVINYSEIMNNDPSVEVNDSALEKEIQDTLDGCDIQQQIRASISSGPGGTEMIPGIIIPRKRSLLFSKIPCFRKLKKSNESETRRLKPFEIYKFADKLDIVLMIVGSIAAIGVGSCSPLMFFIYQKVLDNFVVNSKLNVNTTSNDSNECVTIFNNTNTQSPTAAIASIINYYALLGFMSLLLSWTAWACWITAAERQVRRIRYTLFRNILRQEIGWFDVHNAGELSNRLINDLDRIKDGMSDKVPDSISLFARMVGSLIYALVVGWKLSLVYLSLSPLIVLLFNLTIKMIVSFTIKEVQAFASASSIAQEVLQNIRTVTAFHGQKKEEERFANNLIDAKSIGIKKGFYVGMCQGLSSVFNYSAFAIVVWYGPYLVRTDCSNYSAGSVIAVYFSCMGAVFCLAQCIPNVQNFAEAAGSGIYVFDIIERQTMIDALTEEGDKPQTMIGDIEFDNVIFTYPSRKESPVLNKISLKVPSGKTVALVGPSGCGKSTIIQLIQRFYDPDSGRVLLDGKDISTLNVAWLRSHIGIVSQEPVLFTGSIEDNIRLGKPGATDEEVQNAAKMANAHDFIMALPENYKTTSGDKLSGGQKQRVAIARALISNPTILLLDEATSALDNTSERIVQDALDKAKEGRTTIVIAHRLSTIRNVDLIIGLEHGQVIENGSHDELMTRKGLYYELVTAQTQKEKEKEKEDDSDSESDENDNKDEHLFVPPIPVNRRLSRQSIFSIGNSDGLDENPFETSLKEFSKKKKRFHTPFLYKISKFNAPEWYWILLGTIASLGYGATSPLFGVIFSNIYGSFSSPDVNEQARLARMYAIIGFCLGAGGGIAQWLTSFSFAKSGEALTMRMRKLTFSAMLRQEMGYFDHESNSTGALVTQLSSDASALKGLTGARIGTIFQSVSSTVIGLVFGFLASWKLTLVILCFSPILIIAGKFRGQMVANAGKSKEKNTFTEQGGQYATQAIEHIRTVVALHQENHFIDLYEHAFNQEFKKQMCRMHLTSISAAMTNSIVFFLNCTCFGYGAKLVGNGEIQYAAVFRVFSVVSTCMLSLGRSMAMIPDYSKAKTAALRIMALHKRQTQINPNDESGIILNDVIGNIEFQGVDFRYQSRPTVRVLRDFSLKCPNGNTTALVGPSGGGKSTIIALLQRFYDPLKGKVLLDGTDIKILNIQWLRSLMGLVQQEPVLFNISIRDNIAYGDNSREITQDEIENAARMANIHDLIISLPKGYDTLCGAKGGQLSGGQKQRIAIARALIRSPKILLLDEATSALDNKSEKVVQATLDQARTGRTCLTIAHRLSTIRNSEKIAVVNRGKVSEEGTHEELLRQKGIYEKLTLAQERSVIA